MSTSPRKSFQQLNNIRLHGDEAEGEQNSPVSGPSVIDEVGSAKVLVLVKVANLLDTEVADEEEVFHRNRDAAGVGGGGVGPDDQGFLLFEELRRQRSRLEHEVVAAILEIKEG